MQRWAWKYFLLFHTSFFSTIYVLHIPKKAVMHTHAGSLLTGRLDPDSSDMIQLPPKRVVYQKFKIIKFSFKNVVQKAFLDWTSRKKWGTSWLWSSSAHRNHLESYELNPRKSINWHMAVSAWACINHSDRILKTYGKGWNVKMIHYISQKTAYMLD